MFDVIMIVDWSANATPKRGADSIWSYELDADTDTDQQLPPFNHRTRAEARAHLEARLRHHAGRRVLVGFDFAFGYPAGFADAANLAGPQPWSAIWQYLAETITDDTRNRNNRWAVAAGLNGRLGRNHFWGVPPRRAGESLASSKPAGFALGEFRHSERHIRATTGRHPFSVWQLLGAGAVGSQTLTGIPVLHHLRNVPGLAERTRVWPFETGFTPDPCEGRPDAIVIVEVWPSSIDVDHIDHSVKDARQVVALAEHFAAASRSGTLASAFDPDLTDDVNAAAAREEGWVLLG